MVYPKTGAAVSLFILYPHLSPSFSRPLVCFCPPNRALGGTAGHWLRAAGHDQDLGPARDRCKDGLDPVDYGTPCTEQRGARFKHGRPHAPLLCLTGACPGRYKGLALPSLSGDAPRDRLSLSFEAA